MLARECCGCVLRRRFFRAANACLEFRLYQGCLLLSSCQDWFEYERNGFHPGVRLI